MRRLALGSVLLLVLLTGCAEDRSVFDSAEETKTMAEKNVNVNLSNDSEKKVDGLREKINNKIDSGLDKAEDSFVEKDYGQGMNDDTPLKGFENSGKNVFQSIKEFFVYHFS